MYHPGLCKTNETFSESSRGRKRSCCAGCEAGCTAGRDNPACCSARYELHSHLPRQPRSSPFWPPKSPRKGNCPLGVAVVQPETGLQHHLCSRQARRYSHRGVCKSQAVRRDSSPRQKNRLPPTYCGESRRKVHMGTHVLWYRNRKRRESKKLGEQA